VGALRKTLAAAERWGYMRANPAKLMGPNRQPPPRPIRAYTLAELDAIAAEFAPAYRPLPAFGAATGLRPEEWAALERRDVDRAAGIVNVCRSVSDGEVVELGKTSRSRRQVPLSRRATAALEALLPRLDTPLVFPAPRGGLLSLHNFRRRVWIPALEASRVALAFKLRA
jgi:integrase